MKNKSIRDLIKEILEKGYLMSLATLDDGGPWVSDVIYIYDEDFKIYWVSDPDVRHSKAILKNNNVSGTITISGPRENNVGIQFEGTAEKINGARPSLAKKHFLKRGKQEPNKSDDLFKGDSWYVLKPKKIELIHEELFGFDKRVLDL